MNRNIKDVVVACTILLAIFIGGLNTSAYATEQVVQAEYILDGASLYIDAPVSIATTDEIPLLRVSPCTWDQFDLPAVLFQNRDYEVAAAQGNQGALYPLYTSAQGDELVVTPGAFYYTTELGTSLYNAIQMNDAASSITQIDGFSTQEAFSVLEDTALRLGIDIAMHEDATFVAYAAHDLAATGETADFVDCYYIRAPFTYHNVRLIPEPFILGTLEYYGNNGYLEAFLTADGIESLNPNGNYFQIEQTISLTQPISVDEAVECLLQYLNGLILFEDIAIGRIVLQYVPMPSEDVGFTELLPAWTFYAKFTDGEAGTVFKQAEYFLDAATGEIIQ